MVNASVDLTQPNQEVRVRVPRCFCTHKEKITAPQLDCHAVIREHFLNVSRFIFINCSQKFISFILVLWFLICGSSLDQFSSHRHMIFICIKRGIPNKFSLSGEILKKNGFNNFLFCEEVCYCKNRMKLIDLIAFNTRLTNFEIYN